MKSTIHFSFLFLAITGFCYAQSLSRVDFRSELTPQYLGSGTSTRLPVVFRATVQNLTAYTTYRYFIQGAIFSDLGKTNSGAGNTLLMNPDSASFVYTTGPSIATAGGYSIFKTNASGEYTGWFAFANTGNAKFTAGNYISPTITLADSVGTLLARRALSDSIRVLSFSTTTTETDGTGVWAKSSGTARNLVVLYDVADGSTRPLAITYLESDGSTIASSVQFYVDSVNGNNGRWGTIIPNVNVNGIRRIELRSLSDGSIVSYLSNETGVWNGISTVNPAGGTTPLGLDTLIFGPPTKVSPATVKAGKYSLKQNYPNPFNPATVITYHIPQSSYVTLKVYNALGNEVATLVNAEKAAGDYELKFDAASDRNLASGIYFYKLTAGDYSEVRKMLLIK